MSCPFGVGEEFTAARINLFSATQDASSQITPAAPVPVGRRTFKTLTVKAVQLLPLLPFQLYFKVNK